MTTADTNALAFESIALADLVSGQEHPGGAVNVRATDRSEGICAFTASIAAEGLLQPLLVWRDQDGVNYVVDGSRRLLALGVLSDNGTEGFSGDKVPCLMIIGGSLEEAAAKSLAANFHQLPLHPVDQYEAFASLAHTMPPDNIAARYGITPAAVTRALALGNMAPIVRQAWRNEEIDAATAKVFTLETDTQRQAEIFSKLGKRVQQGSHAVRTAILGDSTMDHLLEFVGRDAYTAAGGNILVDLFKDEETGGDGVNDRKLLLKLVDGKVAEKCTALIVAGWSWAMPKGDMPSGWNYAVGWKRHQLAASKATAEQKAAMGAVVEVDRNGRFSIEYGVQKPGRKVAKEKAGPGASAGKADRAAAEPKLSQAIEGHLMGRASAAIAAALAGQPDVAIAALLAAFTADGEGPVRAEHGGMEKRIGGARPVFDFGDAFEVALALSPARRQAALIGHTASAVDLLLLGDPMPLSAPGTREIVAALAKKAPKELNRHLRAAFDALGYFDGVSKAFIETAVVESFGPEQWAAIAGMTKAECAEWAGMRVGATGWLPPELRAPCYDGPDGKGPRHQDKAKRP